ncbi:hypothetical protein Pint_11629 [Pistacia integerrima]|uniref:Uncharacterized protein n=1 Tax=Pistacia integerrima TaxID=434235 RepID=A0ACC0XHF1_9ROSI|nr:hypothetical protein Pint_11629 [Pistacia integerrima]
MAEVSPSSIQLIAGNGDVNVDDLDNFVRATNLPDRGLSYTVVAIMGPKRKSTLMNNLFDTNFNELDAIEGRSQTTKGIWIDKCESRPGHSLSRCHDIGRKQAANGPLLKPVFQNDLVFCAVCSILIVGDFYRFGKQFLNPRTMKVLLSVSFLMWNLEVTALSSYEEKEEEFKEQVAELRQRFFHSISPGGLAGYRQGVVPASGFSFSVQQIWKLIKENKDLDLPALKVLVATFRCGEIANEKLRLLSADEGWLALEEAIQVGPVPGFGKKLSSVLDTYLSDYDDKVVRTRKRQDLVSKAIYIFHPAYNLMLGHLHSEVFDSFKISLEQLPNEGEVFAAAVRTCLQSCVVEFDQGCAGKTRCSTY